MNFEEYASQVAARYAALDDKEKEQVRRFKETKNGQVMMDLLGPEFMPLFNRLATPKKGLAARDKK